jgi:aryl-alcohol dehydrogenase-like predicted oxidoreductase
MTQGQRKAAPPKMRRIGGLQVSLAGLGTNNFGRRLDAARTGEVVRAALDAGVTHFDTADIYGDGLSEEYLGRALGARRADVTVASKFGFNAGREAPGTVAERAPRALEASLRRLGVDSIDLYYYHKPDPTTPVAEVLEVMNRMREQGKAREIACSNFSAAQLDEAGAAAAELGLRGFAAVQDQFSLLEREPEKGVLDAGGRLGMAFVPYFPLASGRLSGKYRMGRPAPRGTRLGGDGGPAEQVVGGGEMEIVERLAGYAEARGHTLLELALSWLVAHPQVATVIAGATSPEQVRANATATGAWSLTAGELAEVAALL